MLYCVKVARLVRVSGKRVEDFFGELVEIFLWNPQLLGAEGRSRRRAMHVCGTLKLYSIEV